MLLYYKKNSELFTFDIRKTLDETVNTRYILKKLNPKEIADKSCLIIPFIRVIKIFLIFKFKNYV